MHDKILQGFARERIRANAVLAQLDAAGTRRLGIGDDVVIPSLYCPRCDTMTGQSGQMTGRIIGFEGTSLLEADGYRGPFYTVEIADATCAHHDGLHLVCDESELLAA
jgi:hypothetical protein